MATSHKSGENNGCLDYRGVTFCLAYCVCCYLFVFYFIGGFVTVFVCGCVYFYFLFFLFFFNLVCGMFEVF